jgi:histidinol-phosphatase (PHP family)
MHAEGTDEEYVKKAIAEGLETLGFSDHGPYPENAVRPSYYKMTVTEIPEYFASVRALREKYAGKIELLVGYEVEYFAEFSEALAFWAENPPEYLILGQHFVGPAWVDGKEIGVRAPHPSDSEEKLIRYVNEVVAGMETERFTVLAHPDIINYTGSDLALYDREMTRLIRTAQKTGTYLEYNLLGASEKRSYPNRHFWELVASEGAPAIIGCDAHSPRRVADKNELDDANKFLSELGINVLPKIEIRDPKIAR